MQTIEKTVKETKKSSKGITFAGNPVKIAPGKKEEVSYREAVEARLGKIESCSAKLTSKLIPASYNAFVHAVDTAYQDHRPLSISPDHIWLLITQGVATHINENAEALRKKFVSHEGKEKITVRRDDFVKGVMENPWEEVWPEFVQKMKVYIGEVADLFTPTFSTTQTIEIAASQITLMDAMQSYFEYVFQTMCGIPEFTLEGTPDDWKAIRSKAEKFAQYDLEWWFKSLRPVLDEFVKASEGNPNPAFWQAFYKEVGGSGGPYIGGHIIKLFPYLQQMHNIYPKNSSGDNDYNQEPKREIKIYKNPYLDKVDSWGGPKTNSFMSGVSKAPFVWEYYSQNFDYCFLGGFVGISQQDDLTIRPEIGWGVRPA